MKYQHSDIMIHTPNRLSDDEFAEVARQVRNIEGVSRFDRSEYAPNLIMVAYQTGKVHAITILNKLTRMGFNASLVGI